MCPGRFPSPTPSREASPDPCTKGLLVPTRAFVADPHHENSLDFTASASFRKRPQFSDSKSDPVISRLGARSSIASSPLAIKKRATDRRRASDPFESPLRARTSRGNKIHRSPPQGRSVSAQHVPSPPSPPASNKRASPRTPIQLADSESSWLVDVRLRKQLQEPLTSRDIPLPLATEDKRGVIYIVKDSDQESKQDPDQDPNQPKRGIKIGWSSRADYEKRLQEHRAACGYEPGYINTANNVLNSFRAERLIHLDLMDRRKPWDCWGHGKDKRSTHEEWYNITEKMAEETVNKWATFMNEQRPYDWRKQLSPLWEYLLRTRRIEVSEGFDHDVRREQWKEILAPPTYLEYAYFAIDVLHRIWQLALESIAFFWQISTVVYSFITLVMCRNTVALSAFALVSVCACCSVVPQLKFSLRKVRAKGRRWM
jgi:hypothetical protein